MPNKKPTKRIPAEAKDEERTAIHEAGHAVVAYVLGFRCEKVALTHDEAEETGANGIYTSPDPQYGYERETESKAEVQQNMYEDSLVCCAGLAAVHVILGASLWEDHYQHYKDIRDIIEYERDGMEIPNKSGGWVGDDVTIAFIKEQLLPEAVETVGPCRAEIKRLAKILVREKRLSGEEVEGLLVKWKVPIVRSSG